MTLNLLVTHSEFLNEPTFPLGEKYLAEDMAAALEKLGIDACVFAIEDLYSNRNFKAGYALYMRRIRSCSFQAIITILTKTKLPFFMKPSPINLKRLKTRMWCLPVRLKRAENIRQWG